MALPAVVNNIPVPKKVSGNLKYEIGHMVVGSSFRYDGSVQGASSLIVAKKAANPEYKNWKLIVRTMPKNKSVRVFRVA